MNLPQLLEDTADQITFYTKWSYEFIKAYGVFFLPSLTLVLGGAVIYIHPQAMLYVLSIFLVTLGVTGLVCTWKALILKEKLQDFTQKFDGKIMLHGVKLQDLEDLASDMPVDPKDQIIH